MADGHLAILTDSWIRAASISIRLRWFYGFKKAGRCITTPYEAIYPDYVRDNIRICAGWDSLGGYCFHSANGESDAFVEKFFYDHS